MFPDPVYAFRCFVPKIGGPKISAEEKHKDDVLSVGRFELLDYGGFFLASLIHVREIASIVLQM